MPAVRLTTGLGNELHPLLSPTCNAVAFTATYSGHRELYVLGLTAGGEAEGIARLTYTDGESGVRGVLGWGEDGGTITYSGFR